MIKKPKALPPLVSPSWWAKGATILDHQKETGFVFLFLFLLSRIFVVREKEGWKIDTYTKFIPHHMQHHCT